MKLRAVLVLAALFASVTGHGLAGESPGDVQQCGTFPGGTALELARHAFIADRVAREAPRALRTGPRIEVISDLVVVTDDGTLVADANGFDLANRSLQFVPRSAARHRVTSGGAAFEPALGDRVVIGDDQTRALDLAFSFRYFGRDHDRVFLNSDGNLTFERGDSASTARNLPRFLSGPPRIALFFTDVDPSEGGEVRVLNTPDRLVVSWEAVPEWGETNESTFQVELTPDGVIRMRFGTLAATSGIVGLSPGGSPDAVAMVDLDRNGEELEGAVVERFQPDRTVDRVALARAFYGAVPDTYDSLVLWTNFASDTDDAFAFANLVSNQTTGLGLETFDFSASWGSAGRLESFVFMGELGRYPRDPNERVFGAASRPTTLGLLAHEVGHRWLARATVRRTGMPANILLGRQSSHWSFFFDSDASFLEGNEIEQLSEREFVTRNTVSQYSRLDLYLMGLAPASEVAPFFAVADASTSSGLGPMDNESPPRIGIRITGKREDFTIADVESALGQRRPSFEESRKSFRHAWILLVRRDGTASSEEIAKLLDARDAFVPFFNEKTLGRGRLELTVRP